MTEAAHHIDISWEQNSRPACAVFDINPGVTALIGPSGAGKTTVARMLSGLSTPQQGQIVKADLTVFDSTQNINLPPQKRNVGYVTQEPALFPTMSVRENISIGSRLSKAELTNLCEQTNITDLLDRNPRTLSGGEAKRVAIARALASRPDFLILDEPMNGLDPKRRKSLLSLIRKLSLETKTPTLLITHQIEEMLISADHGVLMADGNTLISGTIEDVLSSPETRKHLGINDAGTIVTAKIMSRDQNLIKAQIGSQIIWLHDDGEPVDSQLRLRILARDVGVATTAIDNVSILNQLEARITSLEPVGTDIELTLKLQGSEQHIRSRLTQKSANTLNLSTDDNVYALVKAIAVKEMMVS